jgi:CheY-like chemotaxis protein
VLLDLGLPALDGYAVASALRAAGSRALLVAVSGYGRPQDRRPARDAGFDHHLTKPVHLEALLAVVGADAPASPTAALP